MEFTGLIRALPPLTPQPQRYTLVDETDLEMRNAVRALEGGAEHLRALSRMGVINIMHITANNSMTSVIHVLVRKILVSKDEAYYEAFRRLLMSSALVGNCDIYALMESVGGKVAQWHGIDLDALDKDLSELSLHPIMKPRIIASVILLLSASDMFNEEFNRLDVQEEEDNAI